MVVSELSRLEEDAMTQDVTGRVLKFPRQAAMIQGEVSPESSTREGQALPWRYMHEQS